MPGSTRVGVVEYLEAALKASGFRGKVIANNIANIGTPGFRRKTAEFEKLLGDAMETRRAKDLADLAPEVRQPGTTPVNEHGSDVDLDTEFGELIKNSVRYKTYVRLLTRMYRQMDLAMKMGGE
jgi:flagellar basal-body rod protein FlgB